MARLRSRSRPASGRMWCCWTSSYRTIEGFEVARQLSAGTAPPAVVLISSRDAEAYGPRIGASPVRGFLPKRRLTGSARADLMK